jgi:hypothetical protein
MMNRAPPQKWNVGRRSDDETKNPEPPPAIIFPPYSSCHPITTRTSCSRSEGVVENKRVAMKTNNNDNKASSTPTNNASIVDSKENAEYNDFTTKTVSASSYKDEAHVYLMRYENMVAKQENEDDATIAHLKPIFFTLLKLFLVSLSPSSKVPKEADTHQNGDDAVVVVSETINANEANRMGMLDDTDMAIVITDNDIDDDVGDVDVDVYYNRPPPEVDTSFTVHHEDTFHQRTMSVLHDDRNVLQVLNDSTNTDSSNTNSNSNNIYNNSKSNGNSNSIKCLKPNGGVQNVQNDTSFTIQHDQTFMTTTKKSAVFETQSDDDKQEEDEEEVKQDEEEEDRSDDMLVHTITMDDEHIQKTKSSLQQQQQQNPNNMILPYLAIIQFVNQIEAMNNHVVPSSSSLKITHHHQILQTDEQLMLVLGTISESIQNQIINNSSIRPIGDDGNENDGNNIYDDSIGLTLPEFVHVYKSVIAGMQTLQMLPSIPSTEIVNAVGVPPSHKHKEDVDKNDHVRNMTLVRTLEMIRSFSMHTIEDLMKSNNDIHDECGQVEEQKQENEESKGTMNVPLVQERSMGHTDNNRTIKDEEIQILKVLSKAHNSGTMMFLLILVTALVTIVFRGRASPLTLNLSNSSNKEEMVVRYETGRGGFKKSVLDDDNSEILKLNMHYDDITRTSHKTMNKKIRSAAKKKIKTLDHKTKLMQNELNQKGKELKLKQKQYISCEKKLEESVEIYHRQVLLLERKVKTQEQRSTNNIFATKRKEDGKNKRMSDKDKSKSSNLSHGDDNDSTLNYFIDEEKVKQILKRNKSIKKMVMRRQVLTAVGTAFIAAIPSIIRFLLTMLL